MAIIGTKEMLTKNFSKGLWILSDELISVVEQVLPKEEQKDLDKVDEVIDEWQEYMAIDLASQAKRKFRQKNGMRSLPPLLNPFTGEIKQ